MSINAKLFFGGLAMAAIAVVFFVQAQLVQSGLSQFAAQFMTRGMEPLAALQAAQTRTQAILIRFGADGPPLSEVGRGSELTAEIDDVLARVGFAATHLQGESAAHRQIEEVRFLLSRLKAADGDVSTRMLRRELGVAGQSFDLAITTLQGELAELRRETREGFVQSSHIQFVGLVVLLLTGTLLAAFIARSVNAPVRLAARAVRALESASPEQIARRGGGPFDELFEALSSLETHLSRDRSQSERRFAAGTARLEEEIEKLKRRFEATIGNLPQGFCMLDEKRNLVAANDSFRRIFSQIDPEASADQLQRHPDLEPLFTAQGPGVIVRETPDGQVIEVKRHGLDGRGTIITVENVTEKCEARRRIEELAGRDALTGLPNRTRLHDRLAQTLGRDNMKGDVAVLVLDVDGFRDVNATYGNAVGDAVLRDLAKRFDAAIGPEAFLARTGADDFTVVQTGAFQPEGCEDLALRLQEACSVPVGVEGGSIPVGLSIGMVHLKSRGQRMPLDPYSVLQDAELALAHARSSRSRAPRLFSSAMRQEMDQRRQMESDLRAAIGSEELELYYQPFVDAVRGRVSGFEALMRWRHPVQGIISPGIFVPLAEEVGLIQELGIWALREACRQAATWPGGLVLSVNLSPVQFRDPNLVEEVRAALSSAGLHPRRLQLEVTESLFLENDEGTLETLLQLRALGLTISMDDFGTGYSSLGYLSRFPFDKIKIDQSFVRAMDKPENAAIVRAVIGLSTAMRMAVIAEGVETQEQYATLCTKGCFEMQGYLFSRPRPARELSRLVPRIEAAFASGEFKRAAASDLAVA